jgi:hypothetical protein
VHLQVPRAKRRGDLEADKARPQHHGAPGISGRRDDRSAVLERAQVAHGRPVLAGKAQPHRLGPHREHDRAEVARRAVVEREALASGIEARDPPTEQQLHAELLVVRARVKRHPLFGRLPG